MKKLTLVVAALAALGVCSQAQAYQGSYDAYGYQPVRKRAAPAPSPKLLSGQPAKIKLKAARASQSSKKSKKAAKGGGTMSGGGKPSVSAQSPKTVNFSAGYGAGKIVIDQSAKKLYYTVSSSKAYVYPIAVGKEGFRWTGTQKISRKVDWPDWRPPAEMRQRKPHLPEFMSGGVKNPLGAKALYLGNSLYRIHGTNDPSSIGTAASSGCIRMHNGHVVHLAKLAGVGTTVHVVNKLSKKVASN